MSNSALPTIISGAKISDCGLYRYLLIRTWGSSGPHLPFIMLNPSTADHHADDPTIRRCMAFARREGAAGIIVANLYAFRATKPAALKTATVAVGPENHQVLAELARSAVEAGTSIVCAWGAHQLVDAQAPIVAATLRQHGASLQCLGLTGAGKPRHPLFLPANQPLIDFDLPLPKAA